MSERYKAFDAEAPYFITFTTPRSFARVLFSDACGRKRRAAENYYFNSKIDVTYVRTIQTL